MARHQIFTATCNSIGVSGGPEENILHSGCLGEPAHKQIFHSPKNNIIKSLGFMSSFLNLFLSLVRTNIWIHQCSLDMHADIKKSCLGWDIWRNLNAFQWQVNPCSVLKIFVTHTQCALEIAGFFIKSKAHFLCRAADTHVEHNRGKMGDNLKVDRRKQCQRKEKEGGGWEGFC